jgi:WD40 repeat protein
MHDDHLDLNAGRSVGVTRTTVSALHQLATVAAFAGTPRFCFWHPRKPLLCFSDRATWVWSTPTGQHVRTLEGQWSAWDASGAHFVVTTAHGIEDWHEGAGAATVISVPDSPIRWMEMHPSKPMLALTTQTNGIMRMTLEPATTIRFVDAAQPMLWRGHWHPSGTTFAAVGTINRHGHQPIPQDCRLVMWRDDGSLCYQSDPLPMTGYAPYWHPYDHQCVLVGDSSLIWWKDDRITAMTTQTSYHPWDEVAGWDGSGTYLAVLNEQQIQVILADGTPYAHVEIDPTVGFESLAWHPHEPLFATGSWDSLIRVWSADGMLLHTVSADPRPREWGRTDRTSIGTPMALRWSADGAWLAAALRDGSIFVYGIREPRQEHE